jgi:alpha-L-fucosidase 2
MKNIILLSLSALLMGACVAERPQALQLWYEQPADKWLQAAPIGNGRLGAMVYGGVDTDRIALNESSLWSGQVDEHQEKPFGAKRLAELRKLFFEGNLAEGNRVAGEWLRGNYNSFGTHLPLGDLKISFAHPAGGVKGYRRTLDLATAVSTVEYTAGGVRYAREYFASNPDDVIVVHLTADKPGALSFTLGVDLLREAEVSVYKDGILLEGTVSFPKQGPGGVDFIGTVSVATDGAVDTAGGALCVKNAATATLTIDLRTSYKIPREYFKTGYAFAMLGKAQREVPYDSLKAAHIRDYAALFSRAELSFGSSDADKLPTDVRLQRVRDGKADVGLDALCFQYGRYLLIASSRANSPLPAALQGIWNDNLACNMGWTNDYHLDINTQQNYWLANVGNLAECHTPLFTYTKDLAEYGARTAQAVYGCRGWCAHTVANVWGYSAPSQSIAWGLFPLASSWLASHLWQQYTFTHDKRFLAKTAYPLLKGNATFLLDYMVVNPSNGFAQTGPSISPENWFKVNGYGMCASMMPTGDRALAYEILTSCAEAARILNVDKPFADSLQALLAKLPPFKIGKTGALQEWFEDYDEAQPNHRHTMHLVGLYPLSQISPAKTPELAAAAAKTIERRLAAEGWEDTEWSRANFMCYYARLKDADRAYGNLLGLYKVFARDNLFFVAPGGVAGAESDIFEFDANEAAPAGIAEMLLQSHEGYIELLPALPAQWASGRFKGLCARGGAVVDAEWKNGVVQKATIRAAVDNTFALKLPNAKEAIDVTLTAGNSFTFTK